MYNEIRDLWKGARDLISVCIVEDMDFDRAALRGCLEQYQAETGAAFAIREFSDAAGFLSQCGDAPDLIFMDIVMQDMDGLTAARRLRQFNDSSLLVFVTSMMQYAAQGYNVDALDFLAKPVHYPLFKLCMDRACKRLQQEDPLRLTFSNREGTHSIPAAEITYIESLDHKVIVHTREASLPVDSSLAAAEKLVAALPFFRCHVSYLVNLRYVDRVSGYDVWVNGERLSISRYRRREFLEAWAAWLG